MDDRQRRLPRPSGLPDGLQGALPCGIDGDRAWAWTSGEPLAWTKAEELDLPLTFHIGTPARRTSSTTADPAARSSTTWRRPPGHARGHPPRGRRCTRPSPRPRVLVAEGGADWVPAIGDRMDEAYRQHGMFVRPRLSRLPSEIVRQQVFASFQHDISAVQVIMTLTTTTCCGATTTRHLEGNLRPHQETLHTVFDGVELEIRDRVLRLVRGSCSRPPSAEPANWKHRPHRGIDAAGVLVGPDLVRTGF